MYERRFRQWNLSKNRNRLCEIQISGNRLENGYTASLHQSSSDGNNAAKSRPVLCSAYASSSSTDEKKKSVSLTDYSEYTGLDHASDFDICSTDHTPSSQNAALRCSELQRSHAKPVEPSGLSGDSSYSMTEYHGEAWPNTRSPSPTESWNSHVLSIGFSTRREPKLLEEWT